MDQNGLFLATLLDSSARAHALGAAQRQREMLADRLSADAGSLRGAIAEAESRLRHLAEALAAGCPQLFVAHVAWLRDTYRARGVSLEILTTELESLAAELAEGMPPGSEAVLAACFEPALAEARAERPTGQSPLEEGGAHALHASQFLVHALEGRREHALDLITQLVDDGTPIGELLVEVLGRVQRATGQMWQHGEIQVAEEHLCSEVVAEAQTLLRARIPRPADDARRAIVASVDGNAHNFGARIVSDHLVLAGWRTVFLGADVPADGIAWALEAFQAQLVVLSAALPVHVRATAQLVEAVRSANHGHVPVLVGGGPFAQVEGLWEAVGADGGAILASGVVDEAERLCPVAD